MTRMGREEWKAIVREFEESKLQQKEFAAQKGLRVGSLQFWLYKFRRESRQESPPVLLPVEVVPSAALKARQESTAAGSSTIEAVLPGGVALRFPVGADITYVHALLSALG